MSGRTQVVAGDSAGKPSGLVPPDGVVSPAIQTYTGRQVTPLTLTPEAIDIEDIAHALSQICRWTGHTREFYSVAQHSVLVALNCPSEAQLWGLLHDAPEAYLADLASPLKRSLAFDAFTLHEERIMRAIARKFGLCWPQPASVQEADLRSLATEARDLMAPSRGFHIEAVPWLCEIRPWTPAQAKRIFLNVFELLTEEASEL